MFALLEHANHDGIHWDILIEVPGRPLLSTWRLHQNPLEQTAAIPAEPIPDHPTHFLHYEGCLSGELGSVRRLDRGAAVVARFDGNELLADFAGEHLRGRFQIAPANDGQPRFDRVADEADSEGHAAST